MRKQRCVERLRTQRCVKGRAHCIYIFFCQGYVNYLWTGRKCVDHIPIKDCDCVDPGEASDNQQLTSALFENLPRSPLPRPRVSKPQEITCLSSRSLFLGLSLPFSHQSCAHFQVPIHCRMTGAAPSRTATNSAPGALASVWLRLIVPIGRIILSDRVD